MRYAQRAQGRNLETSVPSALGADPEAKTRTRLIIAPDGALNLLPFEALRDNQGEYLLKSRVISYVPSGTILDVLRRAGKNETRRGRFSGR